jgi:cytochrome oxidase Cu insertion factor (SCO1/SenC/PrrC family)
MRRDLLASAFSLAIVPAAFWPAASRAAGVYDEHANWLDDREQPFSLRSLNGTPTVLTMAYGACQRVCAASVRMMQQVQALADQRQLQLTFVVVGIDPAEDRPADWAQYRADRGLTRANWHFLTGADATVHRLARRLGVRYWRYGEHTMHDFRIVLLSADGEVVRAVDDTGQPLERLLP